jgi:hypothetical protein
MFATILREVTGHFDRRTLTSTFVPTLVFGSAALLTVLLVQRGFDGLVAGWQRQPGTVQAVFVTAFLVSVAFAAFVVSNLRELLDRLFQGQWPGWAARLEEWQAGRHDRARRRLIEADERWQGQEEELAAERAVFPSPEGLSPDGEQTAEQVDAELAEQVDAELAELRALLGSAAWPAGTSARLTEVGRTLAAHQAEGPDWAGRVATFSELVPDLDAHLGAALQRIREERAEVQQELFLWYPQPPRDVLATRMGNLIRASEQHPSVRYGLDAVVLWTRLQPLLPEAFANTIRDAKVSVDLLLNLAMYVVMFGLPLSWWLAWRLPDIHGTPVTWLAVAAVALAGIAAVRAARRIRWRVLAALGAVLIAVPLLLVGTTSGVWNVVLRVEVGAVWTAGLSVLAYLLYRNASHAALAYTERLRTAFDLYRWKVLAALRLELPADLAEERMLWRRLSQFLYRGAALTNTFRYDHPDADDGQDLRVAGELSLHTRTRRSS